MRFTRFPAQFQVRVTLVATDGRTSTTVRTTQLSTGELNPPAVFQFDEDAKPFYCNHVLIERTGFGAKRHPHPVDIQPGETVYVR
jgi:hypothetical protein